MQADCVNHVGACDLHVQLKAPDGGKPLKRPGDALGPLPPSSGIPYCRCSAPAPVPRASDGVAPGVAAAQLLTVCQFAWHKAAAVHAC